MGDQQTLRIRKLFVTSALRQESAWFDTHGTGDPQELPVLAANGESVLLNVSKCQEEKLRD